MAKLGRGAKIAVIVVAVLAVITITFMSILLGTNMIQAAIINMMCPDEAGSLPEDYENIVSNTNLQTFEYKSGLELDVIEPKTNLNEDTITILVFHGGYYLAGGRHNQEPYARLMASKGYRVVNVSYTLGKVAPYPKQIQDANDALNYIADKYPMSKGFVVSGDSAGAHLAAQLGAVVTNSKLKDNIGLTKVISADKLLGVIGNCGFYQATTAHETGFFLIKNSLEILLKDKKYLKGEVVKQMDIVDYVDNYPATLLICGDKDKFLAQAKIMESSLRKKGRIVSTYFPVSEENELGHEFQCNYNVAESYVAMGKIVDFLKSLD